MLSVNDVPATRDIFRRFPVESATIRYAVVAETVATMIFEEWSHGRGGPSRMQRASLNRIVARVGGNR
jgi:hypothetical protein